MTATEALRISTESAARWLAEREATADRARLRRENEERLALDSALAQILNFANAGARSAPVKVAHATVGAVRRDLTDRGYVIDAYTRPDDRGFGFQTLTVRW